jgi:hypothetical protein
LTFLKVLLEDTRGGKKAENGFKKPTWEKSRLQSMQRMGSIM